MLLDKIKELHSSTIVKICFFTLFFSISNIIYGQIKLNKLNNSLHKFIDQIDTSKDTIADKYFMDFEQFDQLWRFTNGKASNDELKIEKAYSKMKILTKKKFAEIIKRNNNQIKFESFDTCTYVRKQIEHMKIFIDCEVPFYITMYKSDNELFLSSNIKRDDKYSYYRSIRFVLSEYYRKQFLIRNHILPTSSALLDVLPYKNINGKMGFKSLSSEQIKVKAEYDTIWRYRHGFWMVRDNNGYNLIDTNYNLVFPNNLKYMRYNTKNWKYIYECSEDGINYTLCISKDSVIETLGDLWSMQIKRPSIYQRSSKLKENQSELDKLTLTAINIQHAYTRDSKIYHYVTKNKVDTLLTFSEYKTVSKCGPILVCETNKLSWDIVTITGEKLRTINQLIKWNKSNKSCRIIEVFDPKKRRFGVYSVYNNTYLEPKYKYIKYSEREEFYIVMDDEDVYYLNSKGQLPLP